MPLALKKSTPVRYKHVTEEKADGATFTPEKLAGFVARQIAESVRVRNGRTIRVLDPAVGEGALLVCLLDELHAQGVRNVEVHGFDTNAQSLCVAEETIQGKFPMVPTYFSTGDFLEYAGGFTNTFLLFDGERTGGKFDVIIANPPYVRTQIMGATQAQALAAHFGLSGRVDLYHAFLLGMIEVLGDDGVAGIIVSN